MKYKLGDICQSISETSGLENSEFVYPINTSDVFQGRILDNIKSIEIKQIKGQFKKIFKKNDILYSEIRPINQHHALIDFEKTENFLASTKLMVIRANEDIILSKYLYIFLTSLPIINQLQKEAETRSGTFPQITFGANIAPLEIELPSIPHQVKVIKFLTSIDKKIEINKKINKNLLEIFDSFFLNFISENSSDIPINFLTHIIEIKDGTHDSPKEQLEGKYLITSKNLKEFSVNKLNAYKISMEDYNKANQRSEVEPFDILMSMIGTVGNIAFILDNEIDFAIKNIALFKTSRNLEYKYFIYGFLRSNIFKTFINNSLVGSTQKYISLKSLRDLQLPIPSSDRIKDFNKRIESIFCIIQKNLGEINTLIQLKETILPRVLSGEVEL